MNKSLIYCTSFSPKLFAASGKKLLDSWRETESEGEFCCAYEGEIPELMNYPVFEWKLDEDKWYQNLFKNNINIISKEEGGNKVYGNSRSDNFNRRLFGFAAKVAVINFAIQNFSDWDYIVQLDCDVTFKQKVRINIIENIFNQSEVFFMLGPKRKMAHLQLGIEQSIWGMAKPNGYEFGKIYINDFTSGNFRNREYKDDGHVCKEIVAENPQFKYNDIVPNHPLEQFAPVLKFTKLSKFFHHNKGFHQKSGVLPSRNT